ncbi:MAG: methyltransferase domain-containing protein [Candidatus Scalindua sp.]|jgi:2-polyprenyl-3-methyl-5-hydroxy-6-metoxy-1,4-benzoquinol methylase|nr:methyltransferase domain-containing protein [Candidatus Scalindua sp.]
MLKSLIKRKIFDPVSISSVIKVINSNNELREIWEYSFDLFPDFSSHFAVPVYDKEIEHRIRMLVVGETFFIKKEIDGILESKEGCSYADVGDTDGSVRLLLEKSFSKEKLSSVGINLQENAVEKIKKRGLDAICADALSLGDMGSNYDIVSAFETVEHLPDPIGFLDRIKSVINSRLILSVPFIRHSRISLAYLSDKWPEGKKPTIENTHIFELSPLDWKKIFLHTGWKIENEWKLMMFPSTGLSRFILQPYWRSVSFEGFWFVSLSKYNKYASQYVVE